MSTGYNDGGVPHGARKVKLFPKGAQDAGGGDNWSAAVTKGVYVVEGFPESQPTSTRDRMDEVGQPSGGFGVPSVSRFSVTAQLATNQTAHAVVGDAFTTLVSDPTTGAPLAANASYVIESLGEIEAQGDEKKQTWNLKRLYGTPANWPAVYDWRA